MSLSCSCYDSDFAWYFDRPIDFTTLQTKKRKRCKSCNKLINVGSTCLRFTRYKYPETEIEERIHGGGSEISLASYYHCETCGEQYFNLSELGFCIDIEDNMFELLREYQELKK